MAVAAAKDFPPWKTLYDWFPRRWRIDGTWERLNAELCASSCGGNLLAEIRTPERSDSGLPVRTTAVGGTERGFDPAKKVEGRKRHLLLDTEGMVLKAKIHSAKVPETKMG